MLARVTAGELNRLGVLQVATISRSETGQVISTWSDVATVYFAMVNQSGREVVTAREVVPEMTHMIKIRYRAGVTGKLRFVYGSRVFDILAVVNPEEANEVLLLNCKEGRSQGS